MRGFLVGLGCALLLHCAGAGAGELVVAVTQTTVPFSYPDERGELTGFNIEFGRAICRKLGEGCRFTPMAFPSILPNVSGGMADIGIANTLKTPERERQVAFSVPFWRSTSSFFGASGSNFRDTHEALEKYRVCAIEGSRQSEYLRASAGPPGHLIAVANNQDTMDGLRRGTCQVALAPTLQILSFLQSPQGHGFSFLGAPLTDQGLGGTVHMVVRPDKPELLRRLDQAIKELILDGTHERLTRRYFPFSIL